MQEKGAERGAVERPNRTYAFTVFAASTGRSSYTKPRHTMSVSVRRKISLAQKARWAKTGVNGQTGTVKPKRTMSAAVRRKIGPFQAGKVGEVEGW